MIKSFPLTLLQAALCCSTAPHSCHLGPGHEGISGTELVKRSPEKAPSGHWQDPLATPGAQGMIIYPTATWSSHIAAKPDSYTLPHHAFSESECVAGRQLQTNSFIFCVIPHHIYFGLHSLYCIASRNQNADLCLYLWPLPPSPTLPAHPRKTFFWLPVMPD